jgi:hypothetical protein
MNANSLPHQGWNGCVTRTVRCATARSSAVDSKGERRRRDVLRDPQQRARQPPHVAVAARAAVRGVRVRRGVLQPPAPPLDPRHAFSSRLRTTTTLAARSLRSIAGTTTINNNTQTTRCHANRGRSKPRAFPSSWVRAATASANASSLASRPVERSQAPQLLLPGGVAGAGF